jgi:two-component system CheB/CheR fusion protein
MTEAELLQLMHAQGEDQTLILMAPDGTVVGWLMGSTRIFGRDAESMYGRTLHCLFTPEDQAALVPENELANAERSGTAEDDRWMVRVDGARFWASGFVLCLRGENGEVRGFAKLLRDRTDVRAQVETLRNRVELLAEEDRRKLLLFGTLAHELRTPLSAVGNAVQLIERAHPNDDRLTYALQILKRQTGYVRSLVDDLLEVVRARSGKTALHYENLELASVLRDVIETVRATLSEKQQTVELLVPATPIHLQGDALRMRQIFVNLLQNASKFSERGSAVFVVCTTEAGEAVVRTKDEGRGISPELLPRVFDALTQAEPLTAEGLGLGLSLVKEYVELHGGTVQVRSEGVGKGSEFTVRLPLVRRAIEG